MFRFESPIYLWLLLLIPVMALIRFWYIRNRKRRLKRFGDPTLVEDLMQGVSKYRPMVKFWLLQAALALLVFMLARPQHCEKTGYRDHDMYGCVEFHVCHGCGAIKAGKVEDDGGEYGG